MTNLAMLAEGGFGDFWWPLIIVLGLAVVVFGAGFAALLVRCYHKVVQGRAMVRNGYRGTLVSFDGMWVFPVLHKSELMDISVKRIEIDRSGEDGLICKDNIRADIKVAFFVRVNKDKEAVAQVAQFLGCNRASQESSVG